MTRPQSECDLLEAVAVHLEQRAGNELYRKAWRTAAKDVRGMKKLTDNAEQISSSSSRPVPELSPAGRLVSRNQHHTIKPEQSNG